MVAMFRHSDLNRQVSIHPYGHDVGVESTEACRSVRQVTRPRQPPHVVLAEPLMCPSTAPLCAPQQPPHIVLTRV